MGKRASGKGPPVYEHGVCLMIHNATTPYLQTHDDIRITIGQMVMRLKRKMCGEAQFSDGKMGSQDGKTEKEMRSTGAAHERQHVHAVEVKSDKRV